MNGCLDGWMSDKKETEQHTHLMKELANECVVMKSTLIYI